MATFIDNILVATNIEERHNELVEEIYKRLEENDLFVKLEKCKWKVRKVEFLEVGPKGVEIQKRKGRRSSQLASIQKRQRSIEIPRSRQLLQEVHKRLHQNSSTTICAGQKRAKMEVEKETEGSIWET